jgi:hypothetical protein
MNFIISVIAFIAGRYADTWTSIRLPYYGMSEGNKLMTKDGMFNLKKNLILSGAAFASTVIFADFVDSFAASIANYIIGIGSIFIAYENYKRFKEKRELQEVVVKEITARLASEQDLIEYFNESLNSFIISHGRLRIPLFGWITSENPIESEAYKEVMYAIIEWVRSGAKYKY